MTKTYSKRASVLVLLALAACQPGIAEYSKSEAPTKLAVNSATQQLVLRFYAGSARLFPSEARQLDALGRSGDVRPADRVTVAAAGGPRLAELREATIRRALLAYGVVARSITLADVPPNHAIVTIGRYLVTLPACPNWSEPPHSGFSNQLTSNYGCATATDLGLMVASPADLLSGEPLAEADGQPAAAAVNRYLNDKVAPPATTSIGPISAAAAGAPAAGGGASSP